MSDFIIPKITIVSKFYVKYTTYLNLFRRCLDFLYTVLHISRFFYLLTLNAHYLKASQFSL